MSTTTQAVVTTPTPGFAKRKARALIGWMSEQDGVLWVSGRVISGGAPDPAHLAVCGAARAAAASRPSVLNQSSLFAPLPANLDAHIAALRANPTSAEVLATLGEPRIVDLSRVCAAQPTIYVEDALQRVAGIDPSDLDALIRLTLPLHEKVTMPVGFDQLKNAWLFSSPNPNLRVVGNFQAEVGPGLTGFGFIVGVSRSYLQVAGLNGRYFLRDGYHRAYGLLAAGITHAPALVKDFATFEEVGLPQGLLPQHTYLGDRPPTLTDYLDDAVSVDSFLPVTTKMVVLQALELSSIA